MTLWWRLRRAIEATGIEGHMASGASDAALSTLTDGIEVVTPHRVEGSLRCNGRWVKALFCRDTDDTRLVCEHFDRGRCFAEARIPESLLVELVEATGDHES